MNNQLKLILFYRLFNKSEYEEPSLISFESDEWGRITSVSWGHETMVEPTQEELDNEYINYRDGEIERDIKRLTSSLSDYFIETFNEDLPYSEQTWNFHRINEEIALREDSIDASLVLFQDEIDQENALEEPNQEIIDFYTEKIEALTEQKANLPELINPVLPTYSEIEDEYERLYQEGIDSIEASIQLRIREKDFTDRWNLIDVRLAWKELGIHFANAKLELKRLISENDEAALISYENAYLTLKSNLDLENQIKELDTSMDTSIFTKAAQLLGTTKFESMIFFSQSWTLKKDYPELYINDNLTVFKLTTSFQTLDESLNTVEKIHDYYDELRKEVLVEIDKHRDNEIQTFLTAKNAL